jgi:dihydrofolate reductase
MRRLVLWALTTLDGCFEGPEKWDLPFHEIAWGPELEAFSLEQAEEVGVLLFGRVTYEGMAAHWTRAEGPIADFMNGVKKVVVSSTLEEATWQNTRLLSTNVLEGVRRLKAVDDGAMGDVFVFGSAELSATLLDAGLVDEVRLGLVPVVLGSGTPFFKPRRSCLQMDHVESRSLGPKCTLLRYHTLDRTTHTDI